MTRFGFLLIATITTLLNGTSVHAGRSQCDVQAARVALENQNTIVDTNSKRLVGTWLSQGCEIRPGPEYVLRAYTFRPDGSYRVIQHHYWDDSCSSPKLTVLSTGLIRLKRDSILNPEAATGSIRPINVSVVPHDIRAAKELDELVAIECPEQNWKSWRRYEEHLVFENTEYLSSKNYRQYQTSGVQNSINTQRQLPQSSGDLACLGSLKWAFNELKLLKIQLRPILDNSMEEMHQKIVNLELLVGDVHSRLEQRENYLPTAFQTPLVKYLREEETVLKFNGDTYKIKNFCNICGNLYSSDKSPPHLIEKPHLPPYIWGEWTSTRCEIRPMGLYLTRKFSFYSEDSVWIGEHKFYQDPFCTIPKFVATAAGHFLLTSNSNVIAGTTNVDFKVERASLTIYSRRMAHEMNLFKSCGVMNWEVGAVQELSTTNGCLQLGIIIPSIHYDVVKVEMNYEGDCLLYLGQTDTDNMPSSSSDRPTAFQVPLVKCGEIDGFPQGLREVLYEDYEDNLYSSSGRITDSLWCICVIFFVYLF